MAISGDGNWLYLGAKTENIVLLFQRIGVLTYQASGLSLAEATVLNSNSFVCDGDVRELLSEGQLVNFLVSYTSQSMSLAQPTVELDTFFVFEGDQRSKLANGDKVSFYNTGAAGTYLYTIATESYDSIDDTTTFYTLEEFEVGAIIPEGTNVYKVNFNDNLTFTVVTGTYDNIADATTFYTLEKIEYTASSGSNIYIGNVNFALSTFLDSILANVNAEYGGSISTNYDGSRLFIGSPKEDYSVSVLDTGVVYVYDRLIQNYEIQYNQTDAVLLIRTAFNLNPQTRILRNGVFLPPNQYVIILFSTELEYLIKIKSKTLCINFTV
jgi:hypothetical protein